MCWYGAGMGAWMFEAIAWRFRSALHRCWIVDIYVSDLRFYLQFCSFLAAASMVLSAHGAGNFVT